MTPSRPTVGFGVYLREAIHAARFPTPTHFARAVGTDPSVVLRWLSEEQRPTISRSSRSWSRLRNRRDRETEVPATHPLVHELARMLADDSAIPEPDRHALETVLDRMLDPYRKVMRRRRSA